MNNLNKSIEERLRICDSMQMLLLEIQPYSHDFIIDQIEKFLILESAFLKHILNELENLKPNELRAVNRNEQTEKYCISAECSNCGSTFSIKGNDITHKCGCRNKI